MAHKIKVSIIIPTYKRLQFINDTLTFVASQKYPREEYEIIVVDNEPSPNTALRELCNAIQLPETRYLHETANGATNARHAGVAEARGTILVFIDDDIICEPDWLQELVSPFEMERVALVAGKVILKYEADVPDWISQFECYLSRLDYGPQAHALKPFASGYSCNMAVARDAFFQVGGLNVCYYGDPKLLYLSGDGECGLARKLHQAGYIVWYSPQAWLYHRVPSERISIEYMVRRARNAGIETVFRLYRYKLRNPLRLLLPMLMFLGKALCHWILQYTQSKTSPKRIRHKIGCVHHINSVKQCLRLLWSRELRAHTTATSYLLPAARRS